MDPALKTLKTDLEVIRDRAMNALNQIEQSQEQRSMRWKCKKCRYIKHFTRPVTLETAGRCPRPPRKLWARPSAISSPRGGPVPPGYEKTRKSRSLAETQETGLLPGLHNLSDLVPVWANRPDRKKARSTRANGLGIITRAWLEHERPEP